MPIKENVRAGGGSRDANAIVSALQLGPHNPPIRWLWVVVRLRVIEETEVDTKREMNTRKTCQYESIANFFLKLLLPDDSLS